jgi:tetratricopeptide (TPR) repeat protein
LKTAAIVSTILVLVALIVGVVTNRARIVRENQRLEDELARYTQAVQANPNNAEAYYNRALVYRKLKQYENALEDFTKAIQLEPENAEAYRYRGLTHAYLGDKEQFTSDYTKSVELMRKATRPTEEAGLKANTDVTARNDLDD